MTVLSLSLSLSVKRTKTQSFKRLISKGVTLNSRHILLIYFPGLHGGVGGAGVLQKARDSPGGPQKTSQWCQALHQETPGGGLLRSRLQLWLQERWVFFFLDNRFDPGSYRDLWCEWRCDSSHSLTEFRFKDFIYGILLDLTYFKKNNSYQHVWHIRVSFNIFKS